MERRFFGRPVIVISLLAIGGIASCKETSAPPPKPALSTSGWYRAVVIHEDIEIPFFISLPTAGARNTAAISNGAEEIVVEHRWEGTRVVVTFPFFTSQIVASMQPGGGLSGEWIK